MTGKEYLQAVEQSIIDDKKIKSIYQKYTDQLPDLLKKIVCYCDSGVFLDDETRILSFVEIADADKELHVQFAQLGILPIADCGDNDFIVYDYKNSDWAKFNIVDKTLFKKRATLAELLL